MVRATLALASILLFALTVLAAFVIAFWGSDGDWTRASQLLDILLPIETLIIGGAVSFYYASRL